MSSSGYFRFPAINTGEKGATVGSRRSEIPNLPRSFDLHPEHRDLASGILQLLLRDEKVLGVYLSGSFAQGKPDRYSDLDLYILVKSQDRDPMKQAHRTLRKNVGELISEFPATHLNDSNQIIALYEGTYPIHVDYQYRSPNELVPRKKDRHVVIFWDNSGELGAWKTKCSVARETLAPNREALQYFEDRFWVWCIYADSKIRRGELWEARDMIEYLRNQVIVRLVAFSESFAFEGNRRIETKFSIESASGLLSTLQKVHSPDAYAKALMRIADLYVELLDKLARKTRVKVSRKRSEGLRKILLAPRT